MKSNDNRGIKASVDSDEFLLVFDTDNSDFARGFACGEIWACLSDEVAEVHCVTTVDNIEMVMRMAEASNYAFNARDLTDDEIQSLQIDDPEQWVIIVMRYQE